MSDMMTTASSSEEEEEQPAATGGEAFRQVPINTLMDHNDAIGPVCDDFTRALKCVCAVSVESDQMLPCP